MLNDKIRIVSLIPSGTEIAATLGLQDKIVGRSHECDYPPEISHLPICTQSRLDINASSNDIYNELHNLLQSSLSIYKIKVDILEKLQPTHILTQDQCHVSAVTLPEINKAVNQLTHSSPYIISLKPKTLRDVWADIEKVGNIFGVDSVKILENLESRVKICHRRLQGLSTPELPRVVCIQWTEPLMVGANWIPELVKLAGGQSLFSLLSKSNTHVTWETLLASNPDVIIFMLYGFDLQRNHEEAEIFTHRQEWHKLHAFQSGRVFVTNGNSYFNRPGPRLVDSVEILAEILHPDIFNYGYKGVGWETV
ncbi:cobalamin-binding protein [Anabaena sp. FACHB-1237]|uniref:cobalamin-binding protein n=1 Tax=Anabaena sp. FACHB-1237 TaxID=2692769 RepID=UPI0016805D1D|nr:cobalamin-binding protein [Anabaena sp. FACHB-1237]MBD2137119.1 cobalamin-binding protein [Anabaena sp. FACHB-1237]